MVTARLPHGRSGHAGWQRPPHFSVAFTRGCLTKSFGKGCWALAQADTRRLSATRVQPSANARSRRWAFLEPTLNGSRGSSAVYTTASHERDSELWVR
jgi:hypothetical protein